METRPANIEGQGAIHIRDLVINALRMRPDRIIVGEVRGEEALDMLQAMNTGHDGSLTTIHANNPRDGVEPPGGHGRHGQRQHGRALHPPADRLRGRPVRAGGPFQRRHAAASRTSPKCVGMEGDLITMQDIFVFEKTGVTEAGQGDRALPRHRHPSEVLRTPEGMRHPTAGFHVPDHRGDRLGEAACTFSVIIAFMVIFALRSGCVGLGMKYFEARRKKHVTGMLQTVAGEPAESPCPISCARKWIRTSPSWNGCSPASTSPTRRVASCSRPVCTWSPTKLVAIMGVRRRRAWSSASCSR